MSFATSYLCRINFYMQISGTLLGEGQVRAIVDEVKNVITASATRKKERSERAKAEDFDADEGELLQEENEQEEEVFDQVSLCPLPLFCSFVFTISSHLSLGGLVEYFFNSMLIGR
jgi:Importin repeat 6